VSEEIPSCGFRGLYESAGWKKSERRLELDEHGSERILGVAEEGEFGQTASLKRLNKKRNGCGWRGRIFCSI
jgi:hypothetical protein